MKPMQEQMKSPILTGYHSIKNDKKMSHNEVRLKHNTCKNKDFFSTCNFYSFCKFIKHYSVAEEEMPIKYIKKGSIHERCDLKENIATKLEEIRKRKRGEIKEKRKEEYDDQIMSSRMENMDFLSRKIFEMELESDIKMEENIEVFQKKYRFLLGYQASFLFLIVIKIIHEYKDIDLEKIYDEFYDSDVIEKKLNPWIIEEIDEIEGRTQIKIYCMFKLLYDVLFKKGLINTDDDFVFDRECNKLKVIYEKHHFITSLPDLTFLNIESLEIIGVKLKSILSFDMIVINLTRLTLNNCNIENIPVNIFVHCIRLQYVSLRSNFLKELPFFPESIETLDFSDNELEDVGIKSILNSSSIQVLDLSENKLENIPVLPNVRELYLYNNKIKNEKKSDRLKFLPHLTHIDLSHNELTRFPSFIPCKLVELNISGNKMSGSCELKFHGGNSLKFINITGNISFLNKDVEILIGYLNKGCMIIYGLNKTYKVGFDDFDVFCEMRKNEECIDE